MVLSPSYVHKQLQGLGGMCGNLQMGNCQSYIWPTDIGGGEPEIFLPLNLT